MPRYFGVKCKKNGTPVALHDLDSLSPTQIQFNALPLNPFKCPVCGEKHEYAANEGFEFEADNSAEVRIQP